MIKEINIDDIIEMKENGEIQINELLTHVQSYKINNELGQFSYNGTIYNGIFVTEQQIFTNEDIQMRINYSLGPLLNFHFVQQGIMQYQAFGKKIIQKEGINTLWSVGDIHRGAITHKKNTNYRAMGVSLTNNYLANLVNKYPDLLTEFYLKHQKGSFLAEQSKTSSKMNIVISQILKAPMMGNAAEIYIDSKVLELVALYLNSKKTDYNLPTQVKCCKRRWDIEKIYEARHILFSNLNTPPSIVELSRQVGINDFKLKCGFKEVFNQTVYGCLFDHKMELARKLLSDTDNLIVDVASECGYDYASHFSTAFKRKYGTSPLEYRLSVLRNIKK